MKKTKILIPAAGLLLLSTAASVTGTVAWFAMNQTVTATGMSVSAKPAGYFLEIQGANDADYSTSGNANLSGELYPVAHESWSSKADIEDFVLGSGAEDNWYYRYSSSTSSNVNLTEKAYISAFTDYVATTTFSVKLHANAGAETVYDLMVSDITIPANKGIHVVIAGANGYEEFTTTASGRAYNANYVLSNTVTSTAQDVKVYIYYYGDDDNVVSDQLNTLGGSVSFTLKVFATDNL